MQSLPLVRVMNVVFKKASPVRVKSEGDRIKNDKDGSEVKMRRRKRRIRLADDEYIFGILLSAPAF